MGKTIDGSINFDRGMVRDRPRDQLPRGAVHDLVDYIPRQLGAPARKRGGWALGSKDLNALSSATRLQAVGWAPFPTTPHLVMVGDTGAVYRSSDPIDSASGVFVGITGVVPTQRPFFHKDRVILLAGLDQSATAPQKYYDSSGYVLAAVGGSPPSARVGASWGDYLLIANSPTNKNRLWASGVGNPDSWDLTTGYFDLPNEVVSIVPMRTLILVFGYSASWTLTGDTPPPGGNWQRRDLFSIGCMDGRSVAQYREYVIWATHTGIFRTDGVTLTDLTEEGGMSSYYQALVSEFNLATDPNIGSGWKAAGGVYRGHYFLTITQPSATGLGDIATTLVCDLDENVWFRFSNIKTYMYASRLSGAGTLDEPGSEELFAAWAGGPRALRISPLWTPALANVADGDGTALEPILETPFYKLSSTGPKRIRNLYVGYEMAEAGTPPKLEVSFVTAPEATDYTVASPLLPAAESFKRRAVRVARKSEGIGFKIAQQGGSTDTRLHELEIEGHPLEESR